jgi:hypothetical protein
MVEEAGCQACEQLSPGEREVKQSMDYVTVKVYTPGVGQACGE